ncbi:hypothetical protein DPMN_193160 [Dreissena polymorpha]|uniref:Uncharacterized protein n=1 Tax=Dreissena polymorpha TaxID=45954 RepID=A0A9D3Y2N6_DREPO|nr:hypothetical protein DPMN_193160 [Dreissena polymorpha]
MSYNKNPGVVIVKFESEADRQAVLNAKAILHSDKQYEQVYILKDKTREERLMAANFRTLVGAYKSGQNDIQVKGARIIPGTNDAGGNKSDERKRSTGSLGSSRRDLGPTWRREGYLDRGENCDNYQDVSCDRDSYRDTGCGNYSDRRGGNPSMGNRNHSDRRGGNPSMGNRIIVTGGVGIRIEVKTLLTGGVGTPMNNVHHLTEDGRTRTQMAGARSKEDQQKILGCVRGLERAKVLFELSVRQFCFKRKLY